MSAATKPPHRILVVEDDTVLRDEIRLFLEEFGYEVHVVGNAAAMDAVIMQVPVDLVVLDIMLPGEDGLSICQQLAGRLDAAIIIISARGDQVDRIVGLELGADDYLAKPCVPRELLARVKAVLRRRTLATNRASRPLSETYAFCGFRFDPSRCRLKAPNGASIVLTPAERALLVVFADHPRKLLSRIQLMDEADSTNMDIYDRSIDVLVSRLRRKMNSGSEAEIIRTVRGVGYIFDVNVAVV